MENYLDVASHIIVIWVLAAITPGANVLLTMNTALRFQRQLAIWSAFGVSVAVMVWGGGLGASGVLIVLNTFPWLFTVMKVLGGLYLLYLGGNANSCGQKTKRSRVGDDQYALSAFTAAAVPSLVCDKHDKPEDRPVCSQLVLSSHARFVDDRADVDEYGADGGITLIWHLFLVVVFSTPSAQQFYRRTANMIDYLTGGLFTLFGIKVMAS